MADEAEGPGAPVVERPPPQDPPAPSPFGDQAQRNPYSPAAQAPYTGPSALDTAKAWFDWRVGQATPEAVEESILTGGGPFSAGAFGGVLRSPLTKTVAKYTHPITGDEPSLVFHGTRRTFPNFSMRHADPSALYGPGIYFTENPKIAGGTGEKVIFKQPPYDLGYASGEATITRRFVTESEAAAFAKTVNGKVEQKARLGAQWDVVYEDPNSGVAPQVRPAFLDIRQPFDADATTIEMNTLMFAAEDRVKKLLASKKVNPSELSEAEHSAHLIKNHVSEQDVLAERGAGRHGAADEWDEAAGEFGWDELEDLIGVSEANKLLRSMGYDAITHIGGGRTGSEAHRVWIVFDPKQIKNPYEYRAKHPLPPLGPKQPTPRSPQ